MGLMGQPAAKQNDRMVAVDTHIVLVPAPPAPPIPTPLPHPFSGALTGKLSRDVKIMGRPAATVGSTAQNTPSHLPTPPGTGFAKLPTNMGAICAGSTTVRINGQPAARNGDKAMTCNDPADLPVGAVQATGTVRIGG